MHSTPFPSDYEAVHAPVGGGAWACADWQPPPALCAPPGALPSAAPVGALKAQLNLPEALVAALAVRYPPGQCGGVISEQTRRAQRASVNGIARGSARVRRLNGRDTAAGRLRDWLAAQPLGVTFTTVRIRVKLKIQRDIFNKELNRYTDIGALVRTWGWVGPLPKSFGYHYTVVKPQRLRLPEKGGL